MQSGFSTTGEILLITGVGGSLGAVIGASGLDKVLREDLFTANESSTDYCHRVAGMVCGRCFALGYRLGVCGSYCCCGHHRADSGCRLL